MTAVMHSSEVELDRDRGLVEQHQAGDRAAFTELYAVHYGRLVRFCRRLTRDSHAAEEIAQEAFARAFASLDRFEGERRFYPWLTVIARRLVIDHARQHRRVESRPDVEAGFARAAEDIAVLRIDGGHVATAVGRLSERHREVLRLRDWEGLTYSQIAERLDVAETAVPPLLHRARAALRREYLGATRGRIAAGLTLAPLWVAARRLRDRVSYWVSTMPDPSVLAAPMAGAILGASLLLPAGLQESWYGVTLLSEASAMPASDSATGGLGVPTGAHSTDAIAPTAEAEGEAKVAIDAYGTYREVLPQEDTVIPGVSGYYPERDEEHREWARRQPIHYESEELGGVYFGVNPDNAVPTVHWYLDYWAPNAPRP